MIVRITPRAEREIDDAIAWWEERSLARARTIEAELAAAYALLAELPEVGGRVQVRGRWSGTLRRLILDRIGYHLYYEVNRESGRVYVLCFHHEKRRPPRV